MTSTMRTTSRLLAVLVLILLALFAAERLSPQITGEVGETVDIGFDAPDMSFFSAETINLEVSSSDDVFAAGSTIKVDGTSADHLFVAGETISVRNVDLRDLFIFGGTLDLATGDVEDDIVAAGGDISIRSTFAIGGSVVVAGGSARIEAPVPADLRVGAGSVYVNSAVGGDARLSGDVVTLGPDARIAGDLLYQTDNLVVQPGAVITGERKLLPAQDESAFEDWGRGAGELFGVFALAFFVGFAILVMAVAAALPGLMQSAAAMIRSKPLASLGLGALIAIAMPVAIVILFITVVGVPLGLLLGVMCLALTPVALAATAVLIGGEARRILFKTEGPVQGWAGRLLWPALGAVVILAFGMIPLVGLLVWILAMLVGLGAVVAKGGQALTRQA